jgi:hypothetical protein
MTVTSSYSNNHDPVIEDEDNVTIDIESRWRRMPVAPALDNDRERIAECDRGRGHVLKLENGGEDIICTYCPARWHNEHF